MIDTLRADYLSPYGGSRWNSPNIAEHLARHGALFENVYAQAPWTLPSMVSLLTGVVPGVLLGGQAASFAIPPEQPTLPELLSGAGYETAAFIANPTMHQGNGFGRGLDDLYISPPDTAFVTLEDELLVRKASTWLRARGERPFYLHVHFLAPHDPYANPVQFLGRSPSRPFYLGRITGSDVHELFLGALDLDDPDADVPHLRALYASEVRWVDRWVGDAARRDPRRAPPRHVDRPHRGSRRGALRPRRMEARPHALRGAAPGPAPGALGRRDRSRAAASPRRCA